jgi:hypothetical protein
MFSAVFRSGNVCSCNQGFTGPHCLSLDHIDDTPSAHKLRISGSPFDRISNVALPGFLLAVIIAMSSVLLVFLVARVLREKRVKHVASRVPKKIYTTANNDMEHYKFSIVTGASI